MSDKITFTVTVDDGYVRSATFDVTIYAEDFEGSDIKSIREDIDSIVEEEFRQRVNPAYDIDAIIERIKEEVEIDDDE